MVWITYGFIILTVLFAFCLGWYIGVRFLFDSLADDGIDLVLNTVTHRWEIRK